MIRGMKAYLTLLIFLFSGIVQAKTIAATYDVTFSIFGKIGEAKVSFDDDKKRYYILVDAGLTGEAAAIGSNRREVHESFGVINNGVLRPELYKVTRSSDHFQSISYFVFYPDEKKVEEYRMKEEYITERHFDTNLFKLVSKPKTKTSQSFKTLDYYANNDLESLFFNVRTLLADMKLGDRKLVHAIGGSRKNKGEVLLTRPNGAKRQELMTLMPKHENNLMTVLINQDIFKSDKGELYISLDKNLLVKEAMLKDVLLFGDIHGYRTSQTELP
jgi:hypothetical protein